MVPCWIRYSDRRSRDKNIRRGERLQNAKYLVSKCCCFHDFISFSYRLVSCTYHDYLKTCTLQDYYYHICDRQHRFKKATRLIKLKNFEWVCLTLLKWPLPSLIKASCDVSPSLWRTFSIETFIMTATYLNRYIQLLSHVSGVQLPPMLFPIVIFQKVESDMRLTWILYNFTKYTQNNPGHLCS